MEPAAIPPAAVKDQRSMASIGPVSAMATPSDVEMMGTPGRAADEGSDVEEDDGLFAGGEDDDEEEEESGAEDDAMEEVQTANVNGGVKRKLVEEEDYD